MLSQFFSRWHLRPAVPGEKRLARQKLGESSRCTSSGVRGSGSLPPVPAARPRGGEMAPASPVASLVVLPTLSAVSYLCFRGLGTARPGALMGPRCLGATWGWPGALGAHWPVSLSAAGCADVGTGPWLFLFLAARRSCPPQEELTQWLFPKPRGHSAERASTSNPDDPQKLGAQPRGLCTRTPQHGWPSCGLDRGRFAEPPSCGPGTR